MSFSPVHRASCIPSSNKFRVVVRKVKFESLLDLGNEVFDSSYSSYLSGHVSEEQWSESINRINAVSEGGTPLMKLALLVGTCIISLGIILSAIGYIELDRFNDSWIGGTESYPLFRMILLVGLLIGVLGVLAGYFTFIIRARMLLAKYKEAVEDENIYYKGRNIHFRLLRQYILEDNEENEDEEEGHRNLLQAQQKLKIAYWIEVDIGTRAGNTFADTPVPLSTASIYVSSFSANNEESFV